MNTGHPRDVDPSITGQPHQVTGQVPDLMGNISRTLGNPADHASGGTRTRTAATLFRAFAKSLRASGPMSPRKDYAAPRCSASHTAVDSRTPSSTALPQCVIHAAIPSGVPET